MKPLDRESEPYSKFGEMAAAGIQKLLGTPRHSRLETVIRETVQNSWDASRPGQAPEYRIHLRQLSGSQRSILREAIFGDLPTRVDHDGQLRKTLSRKLLSLEISDFGTTGLGGSVDPRELSRPNESTDFADFMRNIGTPRDTELGGGTYGYGKTSLYRLSSCATVIVYTHTIFRTRRVQRLMACRLGDSFEIRSGKNRGKYTGRHWWGRAGGPVESSEAVKIAEGLGLAARGPSDLGTTIMIIGPELGEQSPQDAVDSVIECLLDSFWPKMVERDGDPGMRFVVHLDEVQQDIPPVDSVPPLNLLASALRKIWRGADDVKRIACQRPRKHLGLLAVERGFKGKRTALRRGAEPLFDETSAHVALMRPAELVVKYLAGYALPSDEMEWAGVFICDDDEEVEQAFADSEPPAHDDWEPGNFPDSQEGRAQKRFVRTALRRIKEAIDEYAMPPSPSPSTDGGHPSLGALADSLGALLIEAPGQALGGGGAPARSSRGGRRKLRVQSVEFSGHGGTDADPEAQFTITISGNGRGILTGNAGVVVEGGGLHAFTPGGAAVVVREWRDESGATVSRDDSVEIEVDGDLSIVALVPMPGYVAVGMRPGIQELGA